VEITTLCFTCDIDLDGPKRYRLIGSIEVQGSTRVNERRTRMKQIELPYEELKQDFIRELPTWNFSHVRGRLCYRTEDAACL